jgi:glucose-6-phosphate dehydrogenase assembly protein OpcA
MSQTIAPPLEKVAVDVRAIERELTSLWQAAADSAESRREATVTRTCVLNLVALTHTPDDAERATQVVGRLTARHPNRAIVAALQPSRPQSGLDTWVQAHCQLPVPGRPQVCCEQITIDARGSEAVGRIPGVVLPLLVPDVPVVVWLPRGTPADFPAVARLADVTDRLVVDSATFGGAIALPLLADLAVAGVAVGDLTWTRLTRWRELVAQFFDAPVNQPHLAEIERLTVTAASMPDAPPDRAPALLLASWLAVRLGWRVEGAGADARLLRPDGTAVQIETVPAQGANEQMLGVVVSCRRARFAAERAADPAMVETRAEMNGGWPVRRTVRLAPPDEAGLLADELQIFGHDRTFEAVLQVAAALVGEGLSL